jgi:drug/metabolite transporter (DMT)-like permease
MATEPAAQPALRTSPFTASPVAVWTAIVILYVVWGSTYLGIRIAVESIPPFVLAAARFLLAGAIMLVAVVIVRRGSLARPTRAEWRDCFIVGSLLMGGGMGLVAWGEQTVPSGITGVLIAMMPVWVAVFGGIFFRERLPRLAVVGIATGMAGVVLLVGNGIAVDGSLDPVGVIALIISPICWAVGSLYASHRAQFPRDPFLTTGMQMLCGGLVLALAAALSGELGAFDPAAVTANSSIAFVYLTIVGSLVAFTAYAWVLRHAPLPLIATYAFVNPVIAVFLGSLILDEPISLVQLIAGGVVVAGVALIILARSRMSAVESGAAREPAGQPRKPDVGPGFEDPAAA